MQYFYVSDNGNVKTFLINKHNVYKIVHWLNDEEKIKFIIADYAAIEDYRYSFSYTKSINIYSHYSVTKTISHTKDLQLRAPPFA